MTTKRLQLESFKVFSNLKHSMNISMIKAAEAGGNVKRIKRTSVREDK